jgi:hypothetical protein
MQALGYPHEPPTGFRWERTPAEGIQVLSFGVSRKCSERVDWSQRHNACGAGAVVLRDGHPRCRQHWGPGIWVNSGVAWSWVLAPERGAMQEEILLIGGPGHGSTVLIAPQAATWQGEPGTYERRTMRFMARNAANPRSQSLRQYWVADVLVHESIADDQAETYGWWQSYADVQAFERIGRDVSNEPDEVAKFHPARPEGAA